jgi:hypothetical protein
MLGVCKSSAKTYVFGAEVAWVTRSAAARGEFAVLESARKGSKALRARVVSMIPVVLSEDIGRVSGEISWNWFVFGVWCWCKGNSELWWKVQVGSIR